MKNHNIKVIDTRMNRYVELEKNEREQQQQQQWRLLQPATTEPNNNNNDKIHRALVIYTMKKNMKRCLNFCNVNDKFKMK